MYSVRVLGSGGPMHGGGRGSAAYAVVHEDEPLLVVDMGGDTPVALARSGILPGQVSLLLISHLHPDHVSGLPGFIWGEFTAGRSAPLTIIGPEAGDGFHDIHTFIDRLFSDGGAYPDLRGVLTGKDFPVAIKIAPGAGETVHRRDDWLVRAYRVAHGRAPTLAYRFDAAGVSIVFAGDQTARDPGFVSFARSADLLVLHAIVNGSAEGHGLTDVVALPRELGRLAAEADVKKVVLGHLMKATTRTPDAQLWSLADLSSVVADIQAEYPGPVSGADDLSCWSVGARD